MQLGNDLLYSAYPQAQYIAWARSHAIAVPEPNQNARQMAGVLRFWRKPHTARIGVTLPLGASPALASMNPSTSGRMLLRHEDPAKMP